MAQHPLAGKPAPSDMLVNIPRLISAYYTTQPDPTNIEQRVSFGTSGHRGSSFAAQFNEDHILAISQAICEYRQAKGIDGPLYLGMDTHALSEAAQASAIEVFAANEVALFIQADLGYRPTPVISHAIVNYNENHTKIIQDRANAILADGLKDVKRMTLARAMQADNVHHHDYVTPFVAELDQVVDMDAIAGASLKIGVDPMGGAGVGYWVPIAEQYKLNLTVVNTAVDPTFRFMTVDKDGNIRMECATAYTVATQSGLNEE